MSRRRNGEDPEFGSDSFLDIIANIVGILIILIVVAGVKVARQPLQTVDVPVSAVEVVAPIYGPSIPEEQLLSIQADTEFENRQTKILEKELVRQQERSVELIEQSSCIQDRGAALDLLTATYCQQMEQSNTELVSQQADVEELTQHIRLLQDQTAEEERKRETVGTASQLAFERQATANLRLEDVAVQTRKLKELIEEQQAQAVPDAERLLHRLAPVVRTDNEQELHFRLSSGRIAWVPIERLLEHLKRQVSNRGGVIRRFGRYEGVCGPVGGFAMKYTVERQAASLLGRMNGGVSTGFRVAVSRWTVMPTDSLRAETVDEALKFGSRFRQIAEAADWDATMTVWLYPREFAHFRKLREFGHALGLRVAARPLPVDAEITGSPGGSRSSAQ